MLRLNLCMEWKLLKKWTTLLLLHVNLCSKWKLLKILYNSLLVEQNIVWTAIYIRDENVFKKCGIKTYVFEFIYQRNICIILGIFWGMRLWGGDFSCGYFVAKILPNGEIGRSKFFFWRLCREDFAEWRILQDEIFFWRFCHGDFCAKHKSGHPRFTCQGWVGDPRIFEF